MRVAEGIVHSGSAVPMGKRHGRRQRKPQRADHQAKGIDDAVGMVVRNQQALRRASQAIHRSCRCERTNAVCYSNFNGRVGIER